MSRHHRTEVETRRDPEHARTYVAVCSCGWQSRPRYTEQAAEAAATDHIVAVREG